MQYNHNYLLSTLPSIMSSSVTHVPSSLTFAVQIMPIAGAILLKPDPAALHLAEDSDDDKEESRSWKR